MKDKRAIKKYMQESYPHRIYLKDKGCWYTQGGKPQVITELHALYLMQTYKDAVKILQDKNGNWWQLARTPLSFLLDQRLGHSAERLVELH